jgi:hypothetical protein
MRDNMNGFVDSDTVGYVFAASFALIGIIVLLMEVF